MLFLLPTHVNPNLYFVCMSVCVNIILKSLISLFLEKYL